MTHYLLPSNLIENLIYTPSDEGLKEIEQELNRTHWNETEVKMDNDESDWRSRVSESVKTVVVTATSEFLLFDVMVMGETGEDGFAGEIVNIQLRAIYATVAHFEVIHSKTYSMIARCLIHRDDLLKLLHPDSRDETLKKKVKWYAENMTARYEIPGSIDHVRDHARRVLVNCATEGLFFSSKFCSIHWIKRQGLLAGLTYSNELISRDEATHCRIAAAYYRRLGSPLPTEEAIDIFTQAAELECEGVLRTHPKDLPGLSQESLCQFIRYNCDFLLSVILKETKRHYGVKCPYDWMENIALQSQTNFFEKDVSDYQRTDTIVGTDAPVILDDF